jgi:hypothetical protein
LNGQEGPLNSKIGKILVQRQFRVIARHSKKSEGRVVFIFVAKEKKQPLLWRHSYCSLVDEAKGSESCS